MIPSNYQPLAIEEHGDMDEVNFGRSAETKSTHQGHITSLSSSHETDPSRSSFGIPTPSDPSHFRTLILFSLTTILLYADQNLLGPNLTAVAKEFGFTDEERDRKLGGDIALAFFLLGAPASLVVGCLADTWHRNRLFAMVVGIGEGACLLTYFSTTYAQLYVCRAVTGFSLGGALPLIYSVLGDLFSSKDRHAVSAVVSMGTGTGIALGQGLSGFLGPSFGWRLPFLVVSVPAILCALLVLLLVSDPERGGMEKAAIERRDNGQVEMRVRKSIKDTLDLDEQPHDADEGDDVEPTRPTSSPMLPFDQQSVKKFRIDPINNPRQDTFNVRVHWNTFVRLMSTPSVLLCLIQGAPGCVPWVRNPAVDTS